MKKLAVLPFLLLSLFAHSQYKAKLGVEFGFATMSRGPTLGTSRQLIYTHGLKAELPVGKRLSFVTGLRSVHTDMGYQYVVNQTNSGHRDDALLRRSMDHLEAPVGFKWMLTHNPNSKWTASITGQVMVGKALGVNERVVEPGRDYSFQRQNPWMLGGELGLDVSRKINSHLTWDLYARQRWMYTKLDGWGSIYRGLSVGTGFSWRF